MMDFPLDQYNPAKALYFGKIIRRTCRELTDLREKIMKFEILLEETSFVKKKIEAENVGLAEAVDDFMRDKDEAVITKK